MFMSVPASLPASDVSFAGLDPLADSQSIDKLG